MPVTAWARARGVPVREPADYVVAPELPDRAAVLADRIAAFDFRSNPCVDFGRLEERIPACELQPRDAEELCACVRFLRERAIPYKVRGAGHSSGGQVLIRGGVVLDLRRLARVLADDPDAEEITVEGGAQWLAVLEHLIPQGRRPLTLIGNPWATVAGTLAVGGFGDTSHIHGLAIASVTGLTVITPDGEPHAVGPADELFRYVLAGRGQLGVIASATLRTLRRPATLAGRGLRWASLTQFLGDAAAIASYRLYELFRPRLVWRRGHAEPGVEALAGNFATALPAADPGRGIIRPAAASRLELVDLLPVYRSDSTQLWPLPCPALEPVLPLPAGLALWPRINQVVTSLGLPAFLGRGAAVMVVPRAPDLPLCPCPPGERGLAVVLRPELPPADAARVLPALRALAGELLAGGARLYLMAVEPGTPDFLTQQFGDALPRLRALKAALDPDGLCNPGLL